MAIKFHSDGTDFRLPLRKRVVDWLCGVVVEEDFRLGALNFVFCSPERELEINKSFLGHDWSTDVITFDYSHEGVISGDIFIDPAEVAANADRFLAAPEVEMRRVMVHGVLHLCGYGDSSPKEQRVMRAKEDFYLAKFYAVV